MPIAILGPALLLFFSATDFWIPMAHKMDREWLEAP